MQIDAQGLMKTLAMLETGDLEKLIITTEFHNRHATDAGQAILNQILHRAAVATITRRETK